MPFISGTATASAVGTQVDYVEITADVTVSGTTEGTATTCITGNSNNYDGATRVMIEVQCIMDVSGASGTQGMFVVLFEDTTSLGILSPLSSPGVSPDIQCPFHQVRYRTPPAGSHTYTVKAWRNSTAAAFRAGAGGSGNFLPAFLRIVKV